MNTETGVKRKVMNPELRAWAEAQWGTCDLGNSQRTKRAVEVGLRMAARPGASLPEQMGDPAMAPKRATLLKGSYRLLNCRAVDIESLWKPHQAATRLVAGSGTYKTVLFMAPRRATFQDWTTLDYSHHRGTRAVRPVRGAGLGPVGSCQQSNQQGMLLHSVLAYAFETKQILGLAHGQVMAPRRATFVRPEEAEVEAKVEVPPQVRTKKRKAKNKATSNGGRRGVGIEGRAWERAWPLERATCRDRWLSTGRFSKPLDSRK